MKRNTVKTPGKTRKAVLAALGAAALAAAIAAACYAFSEMRAVWLEQCEITDVASQVEIVSTGGIPERAILEIFKLRKGANLAKIDFSGLRRNALAKYPAIRSIGISLQLPRRVSITVEDRIPVARMGETDAKGAPSGRPTGRVVDAGGVVFTKQSGSIALLPGIYEKTGETTPPGKPLKGRAAAALKLLEFCRNEPYSGLGISGVGTGHPDCLVAVLGNYSRAKIAWEGMDSPTPSSEASLAKRIRNLHAAYSTGLARSTAGGESAVEWDATQPDGRIYANTKEVVR